MKFKDFYKFSGSNLDEVSSYLRGVSQLLIQTVNGLANLNFVDNFNGFLWEGTVEAGQVVSVKNELGQVPSGRVVLKARPTQSGTVILDDSQNNWTSEVLYVANNGTADAEVKVYFIR